MAGRRLPRLARADPQAIGAATILIKRFYPWLSGGALMGAAFFFYPGRDYVLVGLMLFLPLLDRGWRPTTPLVPRRFLLVSLGLVVATIALLMWRPLFQSYAITTLLLAAIPEEWFFRAYFMTRLGKGARANTLASVLFSPDTRFDARMDRCRTGVRPIAFLWLVVPAYTGFAVARAGTCPVQSHLRPVPGRLCGDLGA